MCPVQTRWLWAESCRIPWFFKSIPKSASECEIFQNILSTDNKSCRVKYTDQQNGALSCGFPMLRHQAVGSTVLVWLGQDSPRLLKLSLDVQSHSTWRHMPLPSRLLSHQPIRLGSLLCASPSQNKTGGRGRNSRQATLVWGSGRGDEPSVVGVSKP